MNALEMTGRQLCGVIACAGVVAISLGCGARAQLRPGDGETSAGGSAGAGGNVGGTGGSSTTSSGGEGGAPAPAIRGYVWLDHVVEREGYSWEQLALSAAFFDEAFDPEVDRPEYVETRTTPDGVFCDIYYLSGMLDEEPPAPPPEIDGGRITAWAGFDGSDTMAISFDGTHYGVDAREGSVHPMPTWLTPEAVAVTFEGHQSARVDRFADEAALAALPAIQIPPPGQSTLSPGPGGNFRLAWQATPADEIIVRLDFNLDWDNSQLLCHPPPGQTELRLPADWLSEWTWGSGELSIVARHETKLSAGDAIVTIRTARFPRRAVQFDIGW